MTDDPVNAGRMQDGKFQKGTSGNPEGKKKGTRHKTTLAMQALLENEGETLTRKAVELALAGDVTALRPCMDRLLPARKDSLIQIELPVLQTTDDLPQVMGAILAAVAGGEISPSEAQALASLLEIHRRTIETAELLTRLEKLEGTKT